MWRPFIVISFVLSVSNDFATKLCCSYSFQIPFDWIFRFDACLLFHREEQTSVKRSYYGRKVEQFFVDWNFNHSFRHWLSNSCQKWIPFRFVFFLIFSLFIFVDLILSFCAIPNKHLYGCHLDLALDFLWFFHCFHCHEIKWAIERPIDTSTNHSLMKVTLFHRDGN